MKEKGPTFIPGHDIPEEVRITAWEFMGQQVPQNYDWFLVHHYAMRMILTLLWIQSMVL